MSHFPRRVSLRFLAFSFFALFTIAVVPGGAAPPSSAGHPQIVLSSTSGEPGSSLEVSGDGFGRKASGLVIWAGTEIAKFDTGGSGRFSVITRVPVGPVGEVLVEVKTSQTVASVVFTTLSSSTTTTTSTTTSTTSTTVATTATSTTIAPTTTVTPRLTWSAPSTIGYTTVKIGGPGTYDLHSNVDYVVSAASRIDGAVHLRGGRNVVWVGGHIRIPDMGSGPTPTWSRRGLVVSDHNASRGNPSVYGTSVNGRILHIEGLLIDGPDLTEGINTNAPSAIVQLQNVRVQGVHFRNSDDRDGTNGWSKNHPDALQTWGSQRELRIDGFSAGSAYQGIFLKEDAADSVLGPIYLKRVNVSAIEHTGTDGTAYAGHRMLSWYGSRTGTIHLDAGTVRVAGHVRSGWNRAKQNPDPATAFWRGRYWSSAQSSYVLERPRATLSSLMRWATQHHRSPALTVSAPTLSGVRRS